MSEWLLHLAMLIALLLIALGSGIWIPIALGVAGMAFLLFTGMSDQMHLVGSIAWNGTNSFVLTAIPLFVLLGEIILRSGASTKFFRALRPWVGGFRGGLLHTNIVGCSIMAAVTGSSVATAAAIGAVAVPDLKAQGYNPGRIAGSIAGGGTLGILIPPSVLMIVYGSLAQVSIAQLFIAGIVPGVLLALMFMAYIAISEKPPSVQGGGQEKPASPTYTMRERWASLPHLLPMVILFTVILGGIYRGVVTPTEAAAIGVVLSLPVAAISGRLSLSVLREAAVLATRLSGMIVFILVGAGILSHALVSARITRSLADALIAANLPSVWLLVVIAVTLIVLGVFMDGLSMVILIAPLLLPIVSVLEIDLIWFGVYLTLLVEVGLISPPMGMNLFVLQPFDSSFTLRVLWSHSFPYALMLLLMVALLMAFPVLALGLGG